MDRFKETRCFEIDGTIYVDDVECEIEVEVEECALEPYSWGQSRGSETEVNAVVLNIRIGDLRLDRHQADKLFGKDAMNRVDEAATTYYEENLNELYSE